MKTPLPSLAGGRALGKLGPDAVLVRIERPLRTSEALFVRHGHRVNFRRGDLVPLWLGGIHYPLTPQFARSLADMPELSRGIKKALRRCAEGAR